MLKVHLAYTAMWIAIAAALGLAALGGQFWSDGRTGYMLLMFGLAFGSLFVSAVFQSYAATRKMVLDDEA